jgi:hypothetical protein
MMAILRIVWVTGAAFLLSGSGCSEPSGFGISTASVKSPEPVKGGRFLRKNPFGIRGLPDANSRSALGDEDTMNSRTLRHLSFYQECEFSGLGRMRR